MRVDRDDLIRWLLQHGFVELPRNNDGHRNFALRGFKITVPGHGPKDFANGPLKRVFTNLERIGFSKAQVKDELLGGDR